MSSHGRYDDRRRDSGGGRHDSRRRDSPPRRDRRPSPQRRDRSPPPKPRNENELPEQFGRGMEEVIEDNNNVLQKMKTSFDNSPLGELYKCVNGSRKVKVWTRNFKEVRGICTGYVLAFDKHWNLILVDVDEVYLKPRNAKTPYLLSIEDGDPPLPDLQPKVPKKKKAPAAEKPAEPEVEVIEIKDEPGEEPAPKEAEKPAGEPAEKPSGETSTEKEKKKRKRRKRNKDPTTGHRHVSQLFVRGDNIVMISVLKQEKDDD